jgi:hypothetical protein
MSTTRQEHLHHRCFDSFKECDISEQSFLLYRMIREISETNPSEMVITLCEEMKETLFSLDDELGVQ